MQAGNDYQRNRAECGCCLFIKGGRKVEKKTKWIASIVIVVCIGILAGGIYLFNDIFPKAKAINLADKENVVSVSLGCNGPDMTIPMGEKYWEEAMECISKAKPTRQQSLNDYPTARTYYGISIQTSDMQYRYFVYEDGGQVYIEIPYEGIYKTDPELLDLVSQYFQEG